MNHPDVLLQTRANGAGRVSRKEGPQPTRPRPDFQLLEEVQVKGPGDIDLHHSSVPGSWAILTLSRATTASPRWQSGRMVGNDQRVRRPLGVITVTMPESGNRHIDYTVPDDSGRELLFADITCSGFSNDDSN